MVSLPRFLIVPMRCASRAGLISLAVWLLRPAAVRAQDPVTVAPSDSSVCEGRRITSIDVENGIRPVADGVKPAFIRPLVRLMLGGRRTQPGAVEPYVLLEPGSICTDARRRESQRLIRGLPYIASARLRAEPDGDGVRIVVEANDDLRPIVGMTLDDGSPESLTLGTVNLGGTGNLVEGHWRDGGAFRHGFGFRVSDPTVFSRRAIFGISYDRQPIGERLAISVAEPFLTRFQSIAWEVSLRDETYYVPLDRNVADRSVWRTEWRTFNAGALARISLGGVQLLGGGVFTHERIAPADSAVLVTASGFQPVTRPELAGRYGTQSGSRAGAIVGLRALDFTTVDGLQTVEGTHDVARGVQAAVVVGRGVSSDDDHPYLATEVYLGVGGGRSFADARVTAERRSSDAQRAARLVSGRLAWYWKVSDRQTQEVSTEFSGIWREDVPAVLFLDDRLTGPRAFDGAVASGSRLLVGRFERRLRVGGFGRAMGLAAAAFVDAAKLWAGDAPLGVTTDPQFGIGAGFLVAIPRDSRKTIRIDAAYPLSQQTDGVGGIEVRLTVTTAGRRYWREPAAFQRSRIAPMLRSLLGWF